MTTIKWNSVGERIYETGIDKAVLYVDGLPPVPWNGLTSFSEEPTGGEITSYYQEGVRYLNIPSNRDFKATLTSIYTPYEFNSCAGIKQLTYSGLLATNQSRSTFNLSYRTKIGNDISSTDYAYRIHLLYNAIATPSDREYTSVNDTPAPSVMIWGITALPVNIAGFKPTPYRVIDSRKYTSLQMSELQDILYGTDTTAPRFPTPAELTTLLGA